MRFTYYAGAEVFEETSADVQIKRRVAPEFKWETMYLNTKAKFDHFDDAAAFAKQNGLRVFSVTDWDN